MKIEREGKLIGEIKDRTLCKHIDDEIHLMWKFGGTPGIDKRMWDDHKEEIDNIEIATKKGVIFKSTKENFKEHSFIDNFSFGDQMFMTRDYWEIK